jgi:iron complex outermembrane receptor protein
VETESKAVFGQLTFDLTETFRLVGGARYTEESREQLTALASGGLPGPVNPPLGTPFPGSLDFSKATWKAGVEWDAAERSLLYASVATGFKAGGFFVASPPNNTFAPEEMMAYTIGAKNRFLDNRLQLNLEAFYWDYEDQQISFVGGISTPTGIAPGAVTINAGQARMQGAEAELQFALGGSGLFTANVQYLDGEYESLVYTALSASGAPIRSGCSVAGSRQANPGTPNPSRLFDLDCSGKPTVNSPEWTANLGYEHTFRFGGNKGLVIGARTRLESSRYVNIDYLPEQHQDSYHISDAFITFQGPDERWTLTAFVNNIEDETVISGAFTRPVLQTVYGSLQPPRTYGGRFTYRF